MDSAPAVGRLTAVCVVHEIVPVVGGDPGEVTAIDKRPVADAVEVGPLGLTGDTQCDTASHGGPPKALYAYADEDAAWWAAELGREITPGLFGENLRTSGVDVGGAEIGERWQIGEPGTGVLVEVTYPRIPCMTFQGRMGEERWVKRFTDHGAMGAYLRVVVPGTVVAGDAVRVESRPGHGVSVADVFPTMSAASGRALLDASDVGIIALEPELREAADRATARG
jgi:MOSC domain-containing protein YiiM